VLSVLININFEMEVFKSNKGGDKMSFEDCTYTVKYISVNHITWRFSKRNNTNCPAILKTSILKTNHSVTIGHYHFVSKSEVNAMIAISKIKLAAKTSCANLVKIYAQGVSELDERSKSKMPLEETTKRTLKNQRSKDNPLDPVSLNDLMIESKY